MQLGELPKMNMDASETECCPRFNPEGWDGAEISFDNKLFVKADVRNFFYIPLNMGPVFKRAMANIKNAGAEMKGGYLILSYDKSPWASEHYLAAEKDVPGEEMARLSGNYLTKVFEGPYKDAKNWHKEMIEYAKSKGKEAKKIYFFYTTCPKCLKHYGKNYAVGFAEI